MLDMESLLSWCEGGKGRVGVGLVLWGWRQWRIQEFGEGGPPWISGEVRGAREFFATHPNLSLDSTCK